MSIKRLIKTLCIVLATTAACSPAGDTSTSTEPLPPIQFPAASQPKPQPTMPPPSQPAPRIVVTARGKFEVPGVAFADGRDPEATPPLTVMRINVWDNAPRDHVVCSIAHGANLQLDEARHLNSEDRFYFHISAAGCSGWLPETFVFAKRMSPIGDKM